ncbi:hypothetical protein DPX16_6395 [Anabarilius grahami]|uniref:Secreted protein n=1 Tax=Anabarilius grahami TaxID=495550 RepID=A0A3N0YLX7_ANAGA|nr:hypothetical protein DPX16_6395 [Anabarilius grahami]
MYFWSLFTWILLSLLYQPVAGLLQFTAAELLRLRDHLSEPMPEVLHLHPDIALIPRRRYIHRGSRRNFHLDNSKAITSLWSTTRRPPRSSGNKLQLGVVISEECVHGCMWRQVIGVE